MKFKVTYYDIDSDSSVTRECFRMGFSSHEVFEFWPVNVPPNQFKSKCIDHPKITGYQDGETLKIIVKGYQYTKSGGYWKTDTIFESVRED